MEIHIGFSKLLHYLPLLIIAISSVYGLFMVSPVFSPGIPINIDLPFHYGRVVCHAQSTSWFLPTTWCSHGQAGIASFQGYAVVPFHTMFLLDIFMDTLTAFKVTLVLILFALPAGAYYLFHVLKRPLAGSFAYAFLLLEHGGWHSGGFEKIFFVGLFSNALGSAMLLFCIAYGIKFFFEPTVKRLGCMSILTAIFFLSHATTFMFFPIPLFILTYLYWDNVRTHWHIFLAYPFIVFLLVSYWFVPFLYKMDYYVQAGGGNVKTHEIFNYFWNPINKWIAYAGIAGLLLMLVSKGKGLRLIGYLAASIGALWVIGFLMPEFFYFKYIQMIRNLAEMRSFLAIGAAFLLDWIASVKVQIGKEAHQWLLPIALLAVFFMSQQAYAVSLASSANMFTSTQGNAPAIPLLLRQVDNAQGRILVEDTLFNFANTVLSISHPWSMSPAFSSKELIGTGDNLYNKDDFSNTQVSHFMNTTLNNWADEPWLDFLKELNIEYAVVYTPTYKERLDAISGVELVSNNTYLPYAIYKFPFSPSWFFAPKGNITSQEYAGTSGSVKVSLAEDSLVRFRVRHWLNWKATIDGKNTPTYRGKMGLTEVKVPQGNHEIRFNYDPSIWIDWAGILLSVIGSGLVFWMIRKKTAE